MQQTNRIASLRSVGAAALVLTLVLGLALIASPQRAYASSSGNKIAKAAASISYSRTVYRGEGVGTEAYFSACRALASNGYYTKKEKQMQCNVPVAAAVRISGVDPNFPTTNTGMYSYMLKSKDWECLGNYSDNEADLQPGDILIRIAGKTKFISNKDGKTHKAETNHACVFIGKSIAKKIYKKKLKGTDADKGNPGSKRTFVSAHTSKKKPKTRSAACMETALAAYADHRLIVFRHV